jgi:hypothetical protein
LSKLFTVKAVTYIIGHHQGIYTYVYRTKWRNVIPYHSQKQHRLYKGGYFFSTRQRDYIDTLYRKVINFIVMLLVGIYIIGVTQFMTCRSTKSYQEFIFQWEQI